MLLGIPFEFLTVFIVTWFAGSDIIFGGKINPILFVVYFLTGNVIFYFVLSAVTLPFTYFKTDTTKKKLILLTLIIFGSGLLVASISVAEPIYLFFRN
jgi:hypothetical protein